MSTLALSISTGAALVLTPLAMKMWGKLSPPNELSEFDELLPGELKRRNGWIDRISTLLCLIGICTPLWLYARGISKHNPWPLGLGFGLMVILPSLFVLSVTLPQGLRRLKEFGRFYELKYGIGIRGVLVVYVPLAVFGVLSGVELALAF
jgi:hypothetical protein